LLKKRTGSELPLKNSGPKTFINNNKVMWRIAE